MDGEEVDDEDDVEGQRFVEVNGELVSAEEIAGIVTDGHNEKDGFDQMREEQLHRQRMVRQPEEYGDEDESDDENVGAGYGRETDDVHESDLHKRSGAQRDDDDDNDEYGREEDEDGDLQMQIHPDLIAAAHKMGVELDSEQF